MYFHKNVLALRHWYKYVCSMCVNKGLFYLIYFLSSYFELMKKRKLNFTDANISS